MKDLCHDVFGVTKEKKDPTEIKGNRGNISIVFALESFFMYHPCGFIIFLMYALVFLM